MMQQNSVFIKEIIALDPTGDKGERGVPAPKIVNWTVDPVHYRAVPTMSDGKPGAVLDLRPFFEQFQSETS